MCACVALATLFAPVTMALWQDGDYLTPANLNTKGGGTGAFGDRTYSADAFSGATDEAKISACVAQLVVDFPTGTKICFVPASMIPFDASLVTFSTSVHMMREGGSQSLDELDAAAYGLDPTGSIAGVASITAAIARAKAVTFGAKRIVLPAGTLKIEEPIIVDYEAAWLQGAGRGIVFGGGANEGTRLEHTGGYAYGPIIHVGSSSQTLPLTTALVSGSGFAIDFSSGTKWLQLRDASTCDLNGLSALTVELFYKPSSVAAQYVFMSSAGSLFYGDSVSACFRFGIDSGVPFVTIKTTGGTYTASGGSCSAGTIYHIAGAYDGSNLRLFVAQPGASSVAVATTPATGTLIQLGHEDVLLGAQAAQVPEGNFSFWTVPGQIDSPRISDNARYTGTFTAPSTTFTNDSHTLMFLPFDKQRNPLTRAQTKNGYAWLRFGDSAVPTGQLGAGFRLSDIELASGTGGASAVTFGRGAGQGLSIEHVRALGVRRGIYNPTSDSFWWRVHDVTISGFGATALSGVLFGSVAGIGQLDTVQVLNCALPFFLAGNCVANNCYALCGPAGTNVIAPFVMSTDQGATDWVLNECNVDTEGGINSATWRHALIVSGAGAAMSFNGCGFSNGVSTAAAVILSNTNNLVFNACVFAVSSTTVFTKATQPNRAALLLGTRQTNTFVPWSDTAGMVQVGPLGKNTAITYAAAPTFDCSARDAFEVGALTGNLTVNLANATPGQVISLWVIQDGDGNHTVTFGTVNSTGAFKGMTAVTATASRWSLWTVEIGLNGNAYQRTFSTGTA